MSRLAKILLVFLAPAAPLALAQTNAPGYEITTSGGSNGMHAEAGLDMRQETAQLAALEPRIEGDVTYLCGGIGAQESAYMKQEAKGYDLMLTFAARDGSYLADVNVEIQDADGKKILEASCDAPIMLVDVPHGGRYRVRAEASGHVVTSAATIGERRQPQVASVVLSWPQQIAGIESEGPTTGASGGSAGTSRSGKR